MALTANVDRPRKEGQVVSYKVEDDVHIFKGALVAINADGFAEPATDAAGLVLAGVAMDECDNTLEGHTQGGKTVRVFRTGSFKFVASSVTQAIVGRKVFVVDDNEVDETTSKSLLAGVVTELASDGQVWVDIGSGANVGVSTS